MDNTKWMQSYVRKTSFFCTNALESCVPAHENTYWKSRFFALLFIFYSMFLKKWIISIYRSPVRFFLKAGKSQTTVFWVRPTSQLSCRRSHWNPQNTQYTERVLFGCRPALRQQRPSPSVQYLRILRSTNIERETRGVTQEKRERSLFAFASLF